MDLNALERALATVMPRWGLMRLSHKLALAEARYAVRGYDAARRDRRTQGWTATGGSAAAELGPALDVIRRRSRDLVRNNEWAANAKRKTVSHLVGTGLVPRAASFLPKATKRRAADLWASFVENADRDGLTDAYGIQAQAVGEVFEGGAAFIRWHLRPPSFGLKVPLQCQVLDHEYLDTSRTEIRNGNAIVQGIEFDPYGRRVAYWLFNEHPGNAELYRRGRLVSERIDAEWVDHIFRADRAGQITGVPWLAPTMLRFRDVADYEEAELVRKKIEACLTVFVTRQDGAGTKIVDAGRQSTDAGGARLERIAPGLIAYMKPGDDIKTAVPSPSEGYADYLKQQLLAAASGLSIPAHVLTGDLSGANYSSLREGKLDFWAVLDQWQWHMAVPQIGQKMWRRVMRAAAAAGHPIAVDTAAEWTVPKRPWVDPLKDVQAEEKELQLGLETWSEKVAARGYDPELQKEALKKEREDLAGLVTFGASAPAPAPVQEQDDTGAKPAAE